MIFLDLNFRSRCLSLHAQNEQTKQLMESKSARASKASSEKEKEREREDKSRARGSTLELQHACIIAKKGLKVARERVLTHGISGCYTEGEKEKER